MKKLQININDDIVARIDKHAKLLGVTRSALCAMWLGEALLNAEAKVNMTQEYSKTFVQATSKALAQLAEGVGNESSED